MKRVTTSVFIVFALCLSTAHAQVHRVLQELDAFQSERQSKIESRLATLAGASNAALLTKRTDQSWQNEDEEWVNEWEMRFSYTNDLRTEDLEVEWDGAEWQNRYRTTYTYEAGLLAQQLEETWVDDAWEPSDRTIFSYTSGVLSESLSQIWEDGDWVNEERTTITATNGMFTGGQTDVWEEGAWVPMERFTLSEVNGDVVFTEELWEDAEWVNAWRSIFADVTVVQLIELFMQLDFDEVTAATLWTRFPDSTEQEWDGEDWLNVSRRVTELDAENRPAIVATEFWEEGAWMSDFRLEFTYDAQGRISQTAFATFDEEEDEWDAFVLESYTYDANDLLLSATLQFQFVPGFPVNVSRTLFAWSTAPIAVGAGELPADFVLKPAYPNPFNPATNVTYHVATPGHVTVRVYDALGRLVTTLADGLHVAGRYEVRFDASGHASGTYLIRLEAPAHQDVRTVTLLK